MGFAYFNESCCSNNLLVSLFMVNNRILLFMVK